MSSSPNYKAELVGVLGHPVSENPTVVMQEAGFQALNLNWRYLTIEVYPQELGAAMQGVRAFNMKGINLTIPHKVEVLKYLDEVKPDAALMGAVNTVVRVGEKLIGENTDGKGFMHALTHDAKVNPQRQKGAGAWLGRGRPLDYGGAGAGRRATDHHCESFFRTRQGINRTLEFENANKSKFHSMARAIFHPSRYGHSGQRHLDWPIPECP